MILRPQTVRRLMVLLAALLVLVATGAALYLRNEHRKETRLATARETGLKAFHDGDYRAALDSLKTYVSKRKSDSEALYAYGVSRSRIEEPNGKHIIEGINVFTTLLQIDPGNLDAQHSLLDLYTQAFYSNEAVDLADRVLTLHPDDQKALRAKCIALDRLRQYEKSLAVSERLNELNPTDLDQQLISYELMRKLNRSPEAMLARAQKQQQAHPNDPRFAMLLAMAYGNSGDVETGKKWLATAATQPAPDAAFVRHMVRVLDSLKLYNQSQALLDRVTAQNPDPLIRRVLVQRLWQGGRAEQVLKILTDVDPAAAGSDTGLLAFKALALYEIGKKDEARDIVTALSRRSADPEAIAWSMALAVRFTSSEPKAALEKYQAALVRAPDNAVIRYLVGEAYSRLGESELAIASWRRAAELSPSWATPHSNIARLLASGGRLKEAIVEAKAAVRAAPNEVAAAVTLALIQHRALMESPDANEQGRLLMLVEQIQKTVPGEAETLPVYVDLLAKSGRRDDAIAAVRSALSNRKRYDQAAMLRLLTISRTHKLGLENELENAGPAEPQSPRIALARAADLASNGKSAEGLELLRQQASSATTQPVEWKLALTQYNELIHDPAAAGEWVALGDANAKDLAVQMAILKTAHSARGDRDFIARTIDRIKALTGPEGQTWKLERARWLLGGDSGKDAAEAVNTLTEIVRASPTLTEARVLFAAALENTGNIAGAAKELAAASELEPNNALVVTEAARLMQAQGKFDDARTYLERAASTPDLSDDARRRIAGMLAAQGDMARAAKVLEAAGDDLDVPGQLLLAEIQRRQGRAADAEKIYTRLLAANPQLDAIRAAADFYAAAGKMPEAQKALSRIGDAKARPGTGELVRAAFAERHISADAAHKEYLAASAAAPRDPLIWRHVSAFHLRSGNYAEARAAADQGLAAAPEDAALRRLSAASTRLIDLTAQNAALRPVLSTLAAAVLDDRGAADFLTSTPTATSAASQPAGDSMLARLKESISRYPRSLPLHSALVQWHLSMKQFDEAAKAAARTMDAFPNDPDSARIAAGTYRAAGKLDLAAAAAQKWRERTSENPQQADWMIAEIRLAQGDAAAATKILSPYATRLLADPQNNQAILMTLLRAYVTSGKHTAAQDALQPLLAKQSWARLMWLQLASNDVPDADVAAQWIKQVTPMIANDATAEKVALGSAWYGLAIRTRHEDALTAAVAALDPIVAQPEAPADAIFLRGALADRMGDLAAAEANYRRGLAKSPNQPEAMNNLAYAILLRGGDLGEAKTLAAKAVESAPTSASFHDTLARVQSRQGDRDAAIASFQKALHLEPNNLEALIGLATVYSDAGKRDAAAGLMPQIDNLLKARPGLSAPVRRELEALRATMKASL